MVLGGGGSTGNAWLIGVVAGLFDAGVDVTKAELIIGTSAGSTASGQLTAASIPELFAASTAPVPERQAGPASVGRSTAGAVVDHLERSRKLIEASADAAEMRRRMGAAALARAAESDPAVQQHWRSTVAARLPSQLWPEQPVLITAVNAQTGESAVFDRYSGVDLVDAVAASCASGFAYRIGNNQYIDGGYRRNENADLALGYERVLVLSPFGGKSLTPERWGLQLAAQIAELQLAGSKVQTIAPEADAEHMFGANAMNISLRPSAAHAGYQQGRALAELLGDFWVI